MDREVWNRAQACFLEALDLSEAERPGFLDRILTGEPEVGRILKDLLMGYDPGRTEFLVPPTLQGGIVHTVGEEALPPLPGIEGSEFGACTILGLIGEGGMGAVYEGIQHPWGRRVAVKVLKAGLGSSASRRRFEFESRVLAKLDHPGIAQVFASGVQELGSGASIPYFILEFVAGAKRLTEFAQDRGLDLRARLDIFEKVCEAVHFAHLRGVIHRDLKPANILVSEQGVPKIIDFGVARPADEDSVERSFQTVEGALVGTPAYMSPEQLQGTGSDVDARTDVYSLGIVLFELVTGRRPFDLAGKPLHQWCIIVSETAPPRASRFRDGLPPDLDAILQKALAPDPARRYASASALGDDLRRMRTGLPVEARRATLGYHLKLFAKRNRTLVAAGVLILLLIAGSAVLLVVQVVEKERARRAEVLRREQAMRLVSEARSFAEWIILDMTPRVVELPGAAVLARDLSDRIKQYLDALRRETPDRTDLLPTLAESFMTLALSMQALEDSGRPADLVETMDRAISILGDLEMLHPENRSYAARLAEARLFRAEALYEAGEIEQAGLEYEELAAIEPGDGADPASRSFATTAAAAFCGKAWICARNLDYRSACNFMEEALDRLPQPASLSFTGTGRRLHWELQLLYWEWETRNIERAAAIKESIRRRLEGLEGVEAETRSRRAFEAKYHQLAGDFHLYEEGDRVAALRSFALAEEPLRELLAADPGNVNTMQSLSVLLSRIGIVHLMDSRAAEAAAVFAEGCRFSRRLLALSPEGSERRFNLRVLLNHLASAERAAGRLDRASEAASEALEIARAMVAEEPANAQRRLALGEALSGIAEVAFARVPGDGGDDPAPAVAEARDLWAEAARLFQAVEAAQPGVHGVKAQIATALRCIQICDELLERDPPP